MLLHQEYKGLSLLLEELANRFSANDGHYLNKVIALLEQFQDGSVHTLKKRIKVGDIKGLTPAEITFILQALKDTEGLPPVLKIAGTYDTRNLETIGDTKVGMDFILESTEYLGTALAIFQSIKSDKSKYLVLKGDRFLYNGAPLKLNAGTLAFEMLRQIYMYGQGHSVEIKYRDLCDAFRKIDKMPSQNDGHIKAELRKYISTPSSTLGKKIKVVEFNNKPLIETIKDYGIRFNNG